MTDYSVPTINPQIVFDPKQIRVIICVLPLKLGYLLRKSDLFCKHIYVKFGHVTSHKVFAPSCFPAKIILLLLSIVEVCPKCKLVRSLLFL